MISEVYAQKHISKFLAYISFNSQNQLIEKIFNSIILTIHLKKPGYSKESKLPKDTQSTKKIVEPLHNDLSTPSNCFIDMSVIHSYDLFIYHKIFLICSQHYATIITMLF